MICNNKLCNVILFTIIIDNNNSNNNNNNIIKYASRNFKIKFKMF